MLTKLYAWYGKNLVHGAIAAIVLLIIVGLIVQSNRTSDTETITKPTQVETESVANLSREQSATLLGTVRAVSESEMLSEVSGRVTSVPVSLGQSVTAGTVIATIENASERAAVLQAEGVYDAALAAASVSDVSKAQSETALDAAETAAITSIQDAYTTVSNGFFTTIDDLYRDPNSPLTYPIVSDNNRQLLSSERVAFQDILQAWQTTTGTLSPQGDVPAAIEEALQITTRTRDLVDSFLIILQARDSETVDGVPVQTWISDFNELRSSLQNSIASLESAKSNLETAKDNVVKANIQSSSTGVSAASAQVKQALGALASARANLAKTIIISPISGTINELDVNVGDFINSFDPVAKVANNDALEVTVFASDDDSLLMSVGNEVLIEGLYRGVITHIGAGLDAQTQKTEVKIGTETAELVNGDTVTVSLVTTTSTAAQGNLRVPITAIKFTGSDGSVFTVENGVLVSHSVSIGVVRGEFVEVLEGISPDMEIVTDARGLTAGDTVEVI